MKSIIKKLLRYAVPFIALVLIFGFALACNGSEPSTEEVSKVKEEKEIVEEAEEETATVEEPVEEETLVEKDDNKGSAEIEYEIVYKLNLRLDGAITYYVLIDPIDLLDDSFKNNIKEIIRKIVEEKGKKIDIEISDKRSSLENGYKDGKFDKAMNDLEGWENWFTDEISNDLAIHCIATFSGENDYDLYFNTLYFFIYSGYAENPEIDKYVEIIQFNP